MTEAGTPLDRTQCTILPRLIARFGPVLLQDRERLEGLLRDECGSAHRRAFRTARVVFGWQPRQTTAS